MDTENFNFPHCKGICMILSPFHADTPCEPHYSGHGKEWPRAWGCFFAVEPTLAVYRDAACSFNRDKGWLSAEWFPTSDTAIKSIIIHSSSLWSVQPIGNQGADTSPVFSYSIIIDDIKYHFWLQLLSSSATAYRFIKGWLSPLPSPMNWLY